MIYGGWFDRYHLMHLHRQSTGVAENAILFTSLFYLIRYAKGKLSDKDVRWFKAAVRSHQTEPGVYAQSPYALNDPGSHDNATGFLSLSFLLDLDFHKDVKIWGYYWHPRDIIFYSYLRRKWYDYWSFPCLWLVAVMSIISCWKTYKVRTTTLGRTKFVHTDGKLLSLMRFMCTMHQSKVMKLCAYLCDKAIARHTNDYDEWWKYNVDTSTWHKIFKWYFRNQYHPIIKESELFDLF